jgi:hypothetical protein
MGSLLALTALAQLFHGVTEVACSRERADHDVIPVRIADSELSGPGSGIHPGPPGATDRASGA